MSAIYGAIDLNGRNIDEKLPEKFDKQYEKCKIDRYGHILDKNVYMSCGIQYFYKRAEREKLPIYDAESNIYFTADCVIDNRKELIPELGLTDAAADGDIIFAAYKKWGKECASHLQGLFAFVVYDAAKNEVYAAVDQFAQRCLFYHVRDGVFYFSTLFFPIPRATGLKFKENERWLVDAISLCSAATITESVETALSGLNKIESGEYIIVKCAANKDYIVNSERYYDPNKSIPTDWSMTLNQSVDIVKKTMFSVMEKILHEQDFVAAELSSGLDSSTVTCIAAQILGKKNKKVFSYTSVPLKEAEIKNKKYIIYDETEGVNIIADAYDNIEPTFVDCKDRHYLYETEDIVESWELPCKSQQNAVWIDEIARMAAERGAKIILSGSTGNTTLSAGDIVDGAYYYMKKLNFPKAFRILDAYKEVGISKKRILKIMAKDIINYYKWYFVPSMRDCYKDNITRSDIGEKYNLSARFRKRSMHYFPFKDMKTIRSQMYISDANAQLGELDTASSLKYGILLRDPMRTVEFLNVCFTIPIYCFTNEDYARRLVRAGMDGVVPEKIRKNKFARGRQSGDNTYRLKIAWPAVRAKWMKLTHTPQILKYLDEKKLEDYISRVDGKFETVEYYDAFLISNL